MKKIAVLVTVFALIGGVVHAADIQRAEKVTPSENINAAPPAGETVYWLDYFDEGSASIYTWSGLFYMSNLFKPDPGWYPFGVVQAEVYMGGIDGQTTTSALGAIDGVRIFVPGAGSEVTPVAAQYGDYGLVNVWSLVTFASPAVIASGDFYGGVWNSTDVEVPLQGTATGFPGPEPEPFMLIVGGAGPQSPAGWAATTAGYPTTSAASIRVAVDDTIPVELMRFEIE